MKTKDKNLFAIMCRESKNLQEAWKPKLHDRTDKGMIVDMYSGDGVVVQDEDYEMNTFLYKRFWLPTQEDLQELLEPCKGVSILHKFYKFQNDTYVSKEVINLGFSSFMMIVWCLFVHKELWNLVWDFKENKWVKEKDE